MSAKPFRPYTFLCCSLILTGALTPSDACAEDKPRAARSVHLWYPAPAGEAFYNEVIVDRSQPGSYFMVCGFRHGYFGIQERGDDKVVLFSVWDPAKGDDPHRVPSEQRVEVLFQAPDVVVKRFGGEGTGAQSFYKYKWNDAETYRFLVRAAAIEKRTAFAAFFYLPEKREWKHLVTFQTETGGELLHGCYSFVEDFRRDGKSADELRRARFGPGWLKPTGGAWVELNRARFTADATPLNNIDAGVEAAAFFLATGGPTTNVTPLKSTIERSPSNRILPPDDLPAR